MMSVGLRLKRAAIARSCPELSDEERERIFRQWLVDND